MPKKRTAKRKTTLSGFPFPPAPPIDVVTQSDLRAIFDLGKALERLGDNVGRRLDMGAKVEYGPLMIDNVERRDGFVDAEHPVGQSTTANVIAGRIYVEPRATIRKNRKLLSVA
jgi:hypothetical protein